MKHIISASIAATLIAASSGVATAASSTPATTRACNMPNVSASISVPFAPERPEIAKLEAASGVATVRVDIDAQGNLMHSSVVKSSGNHWLDEAALTSAQLTRYTAERDNCESVGGSYALLVEFDD